MEECPICLEQIDPEAGVLDCGHKFCFRCISEWARNSPLCPLCRAQSQAIRKMYRSFETGEVVRLNERNDAVHDFGAMAWPPNGAVHDVGAMAWPPNDEELFMAWAFEEEQEEPEETEEQRFQEQVKQIVFAALRERDPNGEMDYDEKVRLWHRITLRVVHEGMRDQMHILQRVRELINMHFCRRPPR